jgi:endonuclease/exonuclease/phosphatase family metal-dependent hydrolase
MRAAAALLVLAMLGAPARAEQLELRVLSYNTHGLPAWVAGDDPHHRFPLIARLANAYPVVLLQEDFEHHARLRPGVTHPIVERGNPSRFGEWACLVTCNGSGLTFLADLPAERLLELSNVSYSACAGWVSGANDCFATKGFQHARIELAPGAVVHVVNTHLDAGRSAEDRRARQLQLEELRRHLKDRAGGAALILGGDLNLLADDPEDAALRDAFAASLNLADSGAGPEPGGAWTHLDYLYYRSGNEVALRVREAGEAGEFVDAGAPLSDHPAVFARFVVTPIGDGSAPASE